MFNRLHELYSTIRNPITGEDVDTSSNKGKQILAGYVKESNLCSLVYLTGKQIDRTKKENFEIATFEKYLVDKLYGDLYRTKKGYINQLTELFKDLIIYILQIIVIDYHSKEFNKKIKTVKDENKVVRNLSTILEMVDHYNLNYKNLRESSDLDHFFTSVVSTEGYTLKDVLINKLKNKKSFDSILSLNIKNIIENINTNKLDNDEFRNKMITNIVNAMSTLENLFISIKKALIQSDQIIDDFNVNYEINITNKASVKKYKNNEGVRMLKSQTYEDTIIKGTDEEIAKKHKEIEEEWNEIAINNIKNNDLIDIKPICATRNTNKLYTACPDYRDCKINKLEPFLANLEKDIKKYEKEYKQLDNFSQTRNHIHEIFR